MVYDYSKPEYVAVTAPNFINGLLQFYNITEFADYPADSMLRIIYALGALFWLKSGINFSQSKFFVQIKLSKCQEEQGLSICI